MKTTATRKRDADAQGAAELIEPALERRFFHFDVLQHGGDQAELGMHAGAGHDAASASIGDQRAHEGRVLAVAERNILIEDAWRRSSARRAIRR